MPAAPDSVQDICARLLELERDRGLLRATFSGVPLWTLLRMELYYAIAQATGVFSRPHHGPRTWRDILRGAPTLPEMWTRRPTGRHQRDTLIFDHSRKVLVDGDHVDIYTQPLIERLAPGSYEIYESYDHGQHVTPRSEERRFLDLLKLASTFAARVPWRFSSGDAARIAELERAIQRRFHVALPLEGRFRRELLHHRVATAYYRWLLRARRPRQIILVVSYSFYKRPLILAAREMGVETIEIQHGTISPYHMGYHYPHAGGALATFPDRLWTFGAFWRGAADFPLEPDRVEVWGFPHFARQRERHLDAPRREEQTLFISQGVIGGRLAQIALDVARRMPERRFIYKLHPSEYQRWRRDYPPLVEAAALDNLVVVDSSERSLHAWMAESEAQVGVFSTAIYEGLALGCKTCVMNLPGVEYMQRLIDAGHVTLAEDSEALVSALRGGLSDASLEPEAIFASRPQPSVIERLPSAR